MNRYLFDDLAEARECAQQRAELIGQPYGVFNAYDAFLVLRITGTEETSGFDVRLIEQLEPSPSAFFRARAAAAPQVSITPATKEDRRRWFRGRRRG